MNSNGTHLQLNMTSEMSQMKLRPPWKTPLVVVSNSFQEFVTAVKKLVDAVIRLSEEIRLFQPCTCRQPLVCGCCRALARARKVHPFFSLFSVSARTLTLVTDSLWLKVRVKKITHFHGSGASRFHAKDPFLRVAMSVLFRTPPG